MPKDSDPTLQPPRMTILSDHPILRVDEPKDQREPDSFALHSRLGAVFDIIRHKNTRAPLAVAVYGDWGTGKSSAMRWLSDRLAEWSKQPKAKRGGHFKARTVWFDPWKYSKREDVWRGLVAEVILNAIDIHKASLPTVLNAARKFGLFLGRSFLNVLGSAELTVGATEAGGQVKVDLDALTKIADDYRQTSHPEKAYLNDFENALRDWVAGSLASDERMVIFIDDLDRCLPEVVLEVLEALKLYLNIPQLIFVVGLDREVVDAVVKHHYKQNGLAEAKAERYLDKMFQVEVEVPPSQTQMAGYLKRQIKAMDQVADGYWSASLTGWNESYKAVIEEMIARLAEDNPREIKRLLNSTLLRATAAALDEKLGDREPRRFTQGCQVYLIQRVLRKYVPQSDGLLREQEAGEFFEQWSQFIRLHPKFRPPGAREDRSDDEREDDAEAGEPKRGRKVSFAEMQRQARASRQPREEAPEGEDQTASDYKALRAKLPRYRDTNEAYPLLDQPDLWDLLVIPFSADVAAAAVSDRKASQSVESHAAPATPMAQAPAAGALGTAPISAVASPAPPTLPSMPRSVRSAIARTLLKAVDELRTDDLPRVAELDFSHTELSDLTPLAELSGLQSLNLRNTQVSDLTPLAGLSGLQSVNLMDTQVSDLTPLAGLSGLQELHLGLTQISDLTPLAHLVGLRELRLWNTQVLDLMPLVGLIELRCLDLGGTQVSDLMPLAALSKLQALIFWRTQVSDLTPLAELSGLHLVDLEGTQVSDLTPLAGLSGLKTLILDGTQVSDLTPLAELTDLRTLYIRRTKVKDVSVLKHLKDLTIIGP